MQKKKIKILLFEAISGNGIVARAPEGIAAQYAFEGEPRAFERAVFLDGLDGVLRTGGGVSACWRGQRRNATLVESDQTNENLRDNLLHLPISFSNSSSTLAYFACMVWKSKGLL